MLFRSRGRGSCVPILHQLSHVNGLKEGNQSWDEGDIEELSSRTGLFVRIVSTETGFVAFWALVQVAVVSSIADVRVYATVISYWLKSCK